MRGLFIYFERVVQVAICRNLVFVGGEMSRIEDRKSRVKRVEIQGSKALHSKGFLSF